jgi:predicted phosphohydrolase
MSLYAIGDLHLSLGTDKPMDVFGGGWDNYVEKIKEGFGRLDASDTLRHLRRRLMGDVARGESARLQVHRRAAGQKAHSKGNHDYWWTTASKIKSFFAANGISSVDILFNNCFFYGDTAICGTRGWFYEAHTGTEHDKKIMAREIIRLEASLSAAGGAPEKLCFFHYPPVFKEYLSTGIIDMMNRYGVASCWYGHIHGQGRRWAVTGEREGIVYHMVSAAHVDFTPVKVR